ncbi:hypothetical protein BAE44_0005644, partial [Dichanthelium oligosanthes]
LGGQHAQGPDHQIHPRAHRARALRHLRRVCAAPAQAMMPGRRRAAPRRAARPPYACAPATRPRTARCPCPARSTRQGRRSGRRTRTLPDPSRRRAAAVASR